jgi:hypothetical protein
VQLCDAMRAALTSSDILRVCLEGCVLVAYFTSLHPDFEVQVHLCDEGSTPVFGHTESLPGGVWPGGVFHQPTSCIYGAGAAMR